MRSFSRASSASLRRATTTTTTAAVRCATTASTLTLTPPVRTTLTSTATPLHHSRQRHFSSSPVHHNEADSAGAGAGAKQMTSGEEEIYKLLMERFSPQEIQVQDVSGGCGSFYAIAIASKEFKGLKTVKQHMLVNQCLKDVISGIHGLQLKTVPVE